jgi:hypothetical protein
VEVSSLWFCSGSVFVMVLQWKCVRYGFAVEVCSLWSCSGSVFVMVFIETSLKKSCNYNTWMYKVRIPFQELDSNMMSVIY